MPAMRFWWWEGSTSGLRFTSNVSRTQRPRRHRDCILDPAVRLVQMEGADEQRFDLSAAKAIAFQIAPEWGLALGEPFAPSNVSYRALAGNAVLKVAWEGDTESLHGGDARG